MTLRHFTPDEARRAAEAYPGHVVVEAITPRGAVLVVVPVNDKTKDRPLPGFNMTPAELAELGATASIDTRSAA